MTKINIQALYGDDAKYSDEKSIAALEQIDTEHIDALNAALEEFNGVGQLGCDCSVAITHETLADFNDSRTKHWTERGSRKDFVFSGKPAVEFDGYQLSKGQPRRKQMVVDLGAIRAVLY